MISEFLLDEQQLEVCGTESVGIVVVLFEDRVVWFMGRNLSFNKVTKSFGPYSFPSESRGRDFF